MLVNLEDSLHPRIVEKALPLYWDSHFKHAAQEAMTQVEQALGERGLAPGKYFGRRLVQRVFKDGPHVTLSVPLGEDLQEEARLLFEGAFAYYRNYAIHDGTNIDEKQCIRIMVLASELLDLIGASKRSFEGAGGAQGLIEARVFKDADEFARFLRFLWGLSCSDLDESAYFDDVALSGFTEEQIELAFEIGLVTVASEDRPLPSHEIVVDGVKVTLDPGDYEHVTGYELTELGQRVLRELSGEGKDQEGGKQ